MSTRNLVIPPELYKRMYTPERLEEMANKPYPLMRSCGKPMSERRKFWLRTKNTFWHRPWAFVHRLLPGDCGCDE